MAHQFDTGFTVRTPAWHGLGLTLEAAPTTWAEARHAAGLDWEVKEDAVWRQVRGVDATDLVVTNALRQQGGVAMPDGTWMVPVADHKLVARDDTGAALAVVRDSFQPIRHDTMGELLDAVATEAGASYVFETGGSLQGGRKVWALARLDEPYTVPGDDGPTYPYFALQNAHDGEGACRVIPTQVRIVCMNTWRMADALSGEAPFEVVIRHTGNVAERVEQAKTTLQSARAAAKAYAADMAGLAELRYDDAILATFLERFIPVPEGGTQRTADDRAMKRTVCRRMLAESPTLAPLPDTAYKLVQLVGEYTDHLRVNVGNDDQQRQERYLKRVLFAKDPAKVKAHYVDLARELCTVGV